MHKSHEIWKSIFMNTTYINISINNFINRTIIDTSKMNPPSNDYSESDVKTVKFIINCMHTVTSGTNIQYIGLR